jgi:hypothetical protein
LDYFQGVVTEYLRADRGMFVNTECCIQLNPGSNPDTSGPHWYCDAVAVNFRLQKIYLCEVTYAKSLSALKTRLAAWAAHWEGVRHALVRDCSLPEDWAVQPWLFVPSHLRAGLETKFAIHRDDATGNSTMPVPMITELEDILPWKYRSWNRVLIDADADTDAPPVGS